MNDNIIKFDWLLGDQIKSVIFDSETISWFIVFQSGASLHCEAMWRLIEDGTISATSIDHGHLFGRATAFDGVAALQSMAKYRVEKVDLRPDTGDIFITLGTMFELQIISTSAGYEPWQMCHPTLGEWVASGGEIRKIETAQPSDAPAS